MYRYEFDGPKPPLSNIDPLMPLGDYRSSELFYLFKKVRGIPFKKVRGIPLILGLDADRARLPWQMLSRGATDPRSERRPGPAVAAVAEPWDDVR